MHHHDLTSVPLPEQLSPNAELLDDLAELYKIFGDSTRIKILYTLFTEERGVGDIARLLGMTMSAISHQLRILKQARLVKPRREGKMYIMPWQMTTFEPFLPRAWITFWNKLLLSLLHAGQGIGFHSLLHIGI